MPYRVRDLVERLLHFEQEAELEILAGLKLEEFTAVCRLGVGSVIDYEQGGKRVTLELDEDGEGLHIEPRAYLDWAVDIFGRLARDRQERAARFLEEALELAQAEGVEIGVAHGLVERAYSRPVGDRRQEIGQVAFTLDMLAENAGLSAVVERAREFERVRKIPRAEWSRRHGAKAALGLARR